MPPDHSRNSRLPRSFTEPPYVKPGSAQECARLHRQWRGLDKVSQHASDVVYNRGKKDYIKHATWKKRTNEDLKAFCYLLGDLKVLKWQSWLANFERNNFLSSIAIKSAAGWESGILRAILAGTSNCHSLACWLWRADTFLPAKLTVNKNNVLEQKTINFGENFVGYSCKQDALSSVSCNSLREGMFFLREEGWGIWYFFSQKRFGPPLRFNKKTPDPPPLGDWQKCDLPLTTTWYVPCCRNLKTFCLWTQSVWT